MRSSHVYVRSDWLLAHRIMKANAPSSSVGILIGRSVSKRPQRFSIIGECVKPWLRVGVEV